MGDRARIILIAVVAGAIVGLVVFRLAALGKLPVTGGGQSLIQNHQTRTVVQEENAVITAVKNASPSVVAIGETQQIQSPNFGFNPFNPFNPFQQPQPQTPPQTQNNTIGTGFVVSSSGLIVTNKHVVSDIGATYTVVTKDGKKLNIKKIYRDPTYDLALIQTDATNLKPLDLGDSTSLQVGQTVIAIGNALGQFDNTVTTGVVSGLGREVNAGDPFSGSSESLTNLIQTDAAINPGNSGGPLLNSAGQVIGVNVATTQGAQNIGFAIPINTVKDMIDQFNKTGTISRPFLGISYHQITRDIALLNNVPQGAYIQQVLSGTPAEKAGIQAGDIITKIDGQSVTSQNTISDEVAKKKVGDTVTLEVWSNGNLRTVTATLVESPNQ